LTLHVLNVRSETLIIAQSSETLGCLSKSKRKAFSNRIMMSA
jgi:hypothetical protein